FSLVHAIGLYTKISQSRDFAMPNLFSVIVPPGLIDEICPILSHKITAMEKKPNRISVLGLGQMGMKIAQLYLAAGYEVRVWNRSDSKATGLTQAVVTKTALDAIKASTISVVCVSDNDAVNGLLEKLTDKNALNGKVLINLTTGSP